MLMLGKIESVQLMFPQDRNLHGKVFGGILMRTVSVCDTGCSTGAETPSRPCEFSQCLIDRHTDDKQ